MSTIFKISLATLASAALVACDARLSVDSKPTGEPVAISVKNAIGATMILNISEVCYDGVKYIVNDKGGMAPKINRNVAHPVYSPYDKPNNSPFFKC